MWIAELQSPRIIPHSAFAIPHFPCICVHYSIIPSMVVEAVA